MLTIKKIMYKPPATIVFWNDGTKTVSVCEKGDTYNKELGFALCVLKKKYGNKTVHEMLEKYVHMANEYSEKDNSIIWENKPKEKGFRKPNVVKKRVKLHGKPDKYIELTVEPIENESAYNLLEETFKETYFPTEQDFINYIKNNWFERNIIASKEVSEDGICTVVIKQTLSTNSNKLEKQFKVNLGEGMEFTIEFNI